MRGFIDESTEYHQAVSLLNDVGIAWVSSTLLRVEARRTARMKVNEGYLDYSILSESDNFISGNIALYRITDTVMMDAFSITQTIKTADAIHIATAKQLVGQLTGVVTSDKNMFRVGKEMGLPMLTITDALNKL